jgi:hypothetical protein
MCPVPLALPGVRLGRLAAVGAVLLTPLSLTPIAEAQTASKPFSIAFSANPVPAGASIPGGMPAGMTIPSFTMTLRNDTGTQQLGSANVTVPATFAIASAPTVDRGTLLAPSGNTLRLRNLDVAPGGTVTVALDLRLPCVSGPATYAWAAQVKQSNDFNGTGNDLTPPPAAAFQNVVTGACALRYVAGGAPAGAVKDQQIRADAFQPVGADLVSVEAVDGRSPALAERLGWFSGPVALALGETIYPGQLVGSPDPVFASAGVARFSTASITAAGVYTLRASTTAGGFAAGDPRALSAAFQIVDVAGACAAICSATLGATSITGAAGTDTGLVLLSRNVGPDPSCAGYRPPVADAWYEFQVTAQRDKTIVVNYTKPQIRALKNAGALEICFATPGPDPFPTKNGAAAPFDYDGDGAAEGFVGLLPNCPATRTHACVTERGNLKGGGAFIEFFVPSDLGDPRYH